MSRVPVDIDDAADQQGTQDVDPEPEAPPPRTGRRRRRESQPFDVDVEIEREVTKRHMIEAITSVLVVVLYMVFTLFRDRDSGVVVLDDESGGPADDWHDE
jgi:hypothetical protein